MPELTIGIPVRNGSKTIRKTLDSILNQTYKNFHVIISDNMSNDDTAKICLEYSQLDSRIMFIQQNENIGIIKNFHYLLQKSKTKYFVWLSADDYWESTFLEKNVAALNSNKEFVGSISKIDFFDINEENYKQKDSILKSKIKKYYSYESYFDYITYQDRVSFYLRLRRAENMYAIFRTEILKKCVRKCWEKDTIAMDHKILLFIQKFGQINLLNEILLHRSGKGKSSKYSEKNVFTTHDDLKTIEKIFPYFSFSIWFFKNFGFKISVKNIDYLILLNSSGTKYQLKRFFKKH